MQKVFVLAAVLALLCLGTLAWGTITIPTVSVGDPGNQADTTGYGSVAYSYNIGKYEVTASQYCNFLNRVAVTDTFGLYDFRMGDTSNWYGCNIQRSGSQGYFAYSVALDWMNRPVNYVSYWNALRFANWLHNGQPAGPQNASTTEDGAYLISGYNGTDGRTIQRKGGWKWAVAAEDEWYKAAYYKGGGSNAYWGYPMQSSAPTVPSNDIISPDPGNNANFFQGSYALGGPYYRTNVGEFENSESRYGTFDQGGNVWEWNEAITRTYTGYAYRGLRGGSFYDPSVTLQTTYRSHDGTPSVKDDDVGFRIVQAVPEPSSLLILGSGILALAGMIRRRR